MMFFRRKPRVHVYSLCWDDARILPYYLRHYVPLAERFVIVDDGSTDGSLDILSGYPQIEVRRFHGEGDSFVVAANKLINQIWKESRGAADWVIVCNVDEHVYHAGLLEYLKHCKKRGVTAVETIGYQMVSDTFPAADARLCDVVTSGMRWERMDKTAVFDPNRIEEINYRLGRHRAAPSGQVVYPEKREVKLLHFKYLGMDYVVRRSAELRRGLRPKDIEKGLGHRYLWGEEEIRKDFDHIKKHAVNAIDCDC